MKKLIYLTKENCDEYGDGVEHKIFWQIKMFEKNNIEVEYIKYKTNKGLKKFFLKLPFFNSRYNNDLVKSLIKADYIYIRHLFTDFNFITILKKIRRINKKVKILIEIPTYPYDYELKKLSPAYILDNLNRHKLKKYVDRIVTFSHDKSIFGIKTINISNAVNTEKIKGIRHMKLNNEVSIITVARIAFWHGYDRLIEGLNYYYKNGGNEKIYIHIVGDGDKNLIKKWKQKIKLYNLSDNILFYGKQTAEELDEIYNKCQLAVDSLGRHRSKVFYNSTLKGKEYLAKGLPIISGVQTELDNMDFKYYYRVPADDSPIDFFEISRIYHEIYTNDYDMSVVVEYIRNFCLEHFTFEKTFSKVINEMKNI